MSHHCPRLDTQESRTRDLQQLGQTPRKVAAHSQGSELPSALKNPSRTLELTLFLLLGSDPHPTPFSIRAFCSVSL